MVSLTTLDHTVYILSIAFLVVLSLFYHLLLTFLSCSSLSCLVSVECVVFTPGKQYSFSIESLFKGLGFSYMVCHYYLFNSYCPSGKWEAFLFTQ